MQGLFIFLLTFLVVPIIAMLTVAVRAEPFAVAIAAVLLTVGGLLRMAYALMFESSVAEGGPPDEKQLKEPKNTRLRKATHGELPPQQIVPASSYVSPTPGSWRDTNDLVSREPGSITEGTTKLLQNEDEP